MRKTYFIKKIEIVCNNCQRPLTKKKRKAILNDRTELDFCDEVCKDIFDKQTKFDL